MIKIIIQFLIILIICTEAIAQGNITFRHLNTSHGLSYLGVSDMCTDKKGNLWIGTANGLNMFNGKTVEKYFATEYPQLQNSNIVHVTNDSMDRIWVLTVNGNLTLVDEKRKFHRIGLYDEDKMIKVRWLIESQQGHIYLFTSNGHYSLTPNTPVTDLDSIGLQHLIPLPIAGFDTLQKKGFKQVFRYDDDHYFFIQDEVYYLVNYKEKKLEKTYPLSNVTALTKVGQDELMIYDRKTNEVKILNLFNSTSTYPFKNIKDQFGKPVSATFLFAESIRNDQYILTTLQDGIYIYDHGTHQIFNHRHHYADGFSLSNNRTSTIEVNPSGWVFINCYNYGISFYNSHEIVNNHHVFIDESGKGYDGYIAGIATKDNINYYIGTAEGLLQWNRNTNTTHFLQYKDKKGNPLPSPQEIVSIIIDKEEKIWATTQSQGIVVLDKGNKLVRHITHEGPKKYALKMERPSRLVIGPDGYIWVSGKNGLCKINSTTFEVDHFENSILSSFDSTFTTLILFTDNHNLWLGKSLGGVSHCDLAKQEIKHYTAKEGLISNSVFDIGADNQNNIYVGSRSGLSIIFTDGKIKTLTQKDGLLMDRAEGLLRDKHGRMWIGNDIGLVCYNPADSTLQTFDARYGLSVYGFRVGSYFQTPNGEFAFGTPRGFQYFQPDSLYHKKINLNALIHKIETRDIVSPINDMATFHLSSTDRNVTFHFSSVEYSPPIRTYYEYQLTGLEDAWTKVVDINSVRYNSIPPGNYVFKLRISHDNKHWQNAGNEVTLMIAAPMFARWWFQLAGLVSLLTIAFLFVRTNRKKQQSQRELLETEVVINYFASQINRHKNIEEMLWDVAKNCISKLNLEDCVIYMLDPVRNVLVQKAAIGPKSPIGKTILSPIEIPVGQGITGTVALTNKAEIIPNTEKDPRYIVDEERRFSEIAVPLSIDGHVIGVIDSEHPSKNFFTHKHMSLLTAIAVLSANQIQRIHAEEEKLKAEMEVLLNKQKAAESRLQSLRLQMNPHFLFNALNSIQQMILANEEMVATKYLSRFSKLLRMILIHSDKETISLKEELDILKLYVELESVRFKEAFTYEINCDEEIDADEVKIPTLLIQPFVENAIWHGLMHKEGMRHLKIDFSDKGDYVECVVEDNGIGRQKAKEMKVRTGQDKKHTSKGIEVSLERMKAMHKNGGAKGSLEIIDLTDHTGNSLGTRVEIHLPIQN
ncbi:MAG TPA: histidine kinase [Saprospiraceae bacterium]